MNALVDAALSFVRDGGPRTSSALVDLSSLVQTVCDGFSDIVQDVRAEGLRPTLTRGSAEALQRALVNLVDNAVKYGGGAVVRLAPAGEGEVAVEVLDEGPGIPEEERAAMLRPFVRGDRARTLVGTGGFGLGLAIAHAIAEAHGGRLALENRAPRGCGRCCGCLPWRRRPAGGEAEAGALPPRPSPPSAGEGPRGGRAGRDDSPARGGRDADPVAALHVC